MFIRFPLRRVIFGALLVVAGPWLAPTGALAAAPKMNVEELSLGATSGYDSVRGVAMSVDGNHVVFIGVRGKQQFVVLDGKSSPAYEWIIPESVDCGPDGRHLAYLIQTASDTQAVIDGKILPGYYTVDHSRIFFSPDGLRTAFGIEFQSGGAAMVINGMTGPKYDAVDVPIFSPDSKRIVYGAKRGNQAFLNLDGQEQKAYDAVGRVTFSPNSKHLTYEARVGGKSVLVLNGQEGKPYDGVKLGPGFSNDGSRLVAVVAQAGKLLVLVNGRESSPYEALVVGDFVLSLDGKRITYAVKFGQQQYAVLDGIAQPAFDHIGANSMGFSPDSKRFAYVAGAGPNGPDFVVLDGIRKHDCEGVLAGTPMFSPDSKRMAFAGKFSGRWYMIVDGLVGKAYDLIEPPSAEIFSPDSQHLAYRAANANKPVVVWDGAESAPAERVGPVSFSLDSKHIAYMHVRDKKSYLVLDKAEVAGPYNANSPEMRVVFDDLATAHVITTRDDEFFRVKIKF